MAGTRMIVRGLNSTATAQRAIAHVAPSPLSMRTTVEMYSDQAVILEEGVSYVRSKFSPHRYFVVVIEHGYCSCEKANCAHLKSVQALLPVEEVKEPTPSVAAKMHCLGEVTGKVIPSTAKIDYSKGKITVKVGETFFGVRSDRYPRWAYIVAFDAKRSQYVCSCGNPKCVEHVGAVKKHVAVKYAVKVQEAPAVRPEQIIGSEAWYAALHAEEYAAQAPERERAMIKSEFASIVVDTVAAMINAQFNKTVVRRGTSLLSQKEAA